MMRIPKVYGKSKDSDCPFCGKQTTCQNPQGIAVCRYHKEKIVDEIKCICGSWLEPRSGKFGRYYNCINCGNVNESKVLQIKGMTAPTLTDEPVERSIEPASKKEVTISSKDVDYFD
tara:strand:- start:2743 stop:3093 length:351 start_codon:yes stop_codon:yes gene_type:complete